MPTGGHCAIAEEEERALGRRVLDFGYWGMGYWTLSTRAAGIGRWVLDLGYLDVWYWGVGSV